MSDDEVPVPVFEGEYSEALFLKTLIESAGIDASLGTSRRLLAGPQGASAIYVRRADVEHAMELVNDFRKNGKRTERWPWGSD